jgi:hypothetical protein
MKTVKKADLPGKICQVCKKHFKWRKKWEKNWEDVIYCSKQPRGKPTRHYQENIL